MKYIQMLCVQSALISGFNIHALNITATHLSLRSPGINLAREFVGWHQHIYKPHAETWYGSVSITPEYTHSIDTKELRRSLFGPSLQPEKFECDKLLVISGSRTEKRNERDLLADYFGLPTDFKSTLYIDPRIQNAILDVNMYIGINWQCHNLFVQIHAPYVYSKWESRICETVIERGNNNHDALYFCPDSVPRTQLLPNARNYFAGNAPQFKDTIFTPLSCGKLDDSCAESSAHHFADVQINIGTHLLYDDEYSAALGVRIVAPTGNARTGTLLLEPIVGNGHHWELGAHANLYALLWEHPSNAHTITGHALTNITYIFLSTQSRCFDLCDKPNSRYMLAQKLGTTRSNPHLVGDSDVGVEFQNVFKPIANITHMDVRVGGTFQADVVLALSYHTEQFSFDFGYNYWYRGCEEIHFKDRCIPRDIDGKTWGLKGDANVFGFINQSNPAYTLYCDQPTVPLAATERNATIHAGTNNYPRGVNGATFSQNAGVDNRVFAEAACQNEPSVSVLDINNKMMYSSRTPFGISILDLDKGGTQGSSQKLFIHVNYQWTTRKQTRKFFIGLGGEVELGATTYIPYDKRNCPSTCIIDECISSSLSQWGVWIKGGFSFE